MFRTRTKLNTPEEITHNNMVYHISFTYDGVAYYYRIADYNDETNTIVITGDNIVDGTEANNMLCDAVDSYIINRKRGAYVSDEFMPLFQYRRDNIKSLGSVSH